VYVSLATSKSWMVWRSQVALLHYADNKVLVAKCGCNVCFVVWAAEWDGEVIGELHRDLACSFQL
jgi:hypothetical protein